jgi:hypothetical protein
LLLKLDITKAFDSVSWPFLIEVMKQLDFRQIWRDIICGLLASSSTQVLLNGFTRKHIIHRRGLGQGDPLSPMLFILVMDILGLLFSRAEEVGLLQQLSGRTKFHRISLYVDDVVLFLHPSTVDISITMNLLDLFGKASGLHNNEQKSNVFLIQCSEDDLMVVQNLLPSERCDFPCRYLGIPLSIRKLTKDQFQPFIDRFADRLPSWKADLMTRTGRKVMVQHVLASMIVYLAMAIDIPPWALHAIDKIRRGFLWRGRKDAKGGHCLIAWGRVCRPLHLGGLGISSLKELCWALHMRWLWLHKSDPGRPWANLPIQVPRKVKAFFDTVLISEVGNGARTLFWTDKWLLGQRVSDLAPRLFAIIPKRIANNRSVLEALTNRKWISDIKGALLVGVIVDYVQLWDLLSKVVLQPEAEDKHIFSLARDGKCSAKTAYEVSL